MADCDEHLQVKACGQKNKHCDILQIPQHDFFLCFGSVCWVVLCVFVSLRVSGCVCVFYLGRRLHEQTADIRGWEGEEDCGA